jgi:hypothetical protein
MDETTYINSLKSKRNAPSLSKANKYLKKLKSSKERTDYNTKVADYQKTSTSYTSGLSSEDINKIFLQRIGEVITGDYTTVANLWDYILTGAGNDSYNSLRKGFIYTLDISDYYKTNEDVLGTDYWSSTHSFDSRKALTKEDLEKYDTAYKLKYNDTSKTIGAATKLKYVATDTERALHTYYSTSNVMTKENTESGKISILCGINTYGTSLATAINQQLENGSTVDGDTVAYENMPINYSQFKFDSTNNLLVQKTRFPDIYYYCYSDNSEKGFYSYSSLNGYGSMSEFLSTGSSIISSASSIQQSITKHMINTVSTPKNTSSLNEATRHKYLNEAIGLLEESMPDFSPNMFDVILADMTEKIDYSRVPKSDPLATNSWGHTAFNGPIQNYSDRYSYEKNVITERTFAFRVGSISIPQAETSKEDYKFLNTSVPLVNSTVKMNYSSLLTLRLDQAMLFADRFTKEGGNFVFDRVSNIPKSTQMFQSARKFALHSVFFNSGSLDGSFSSYNLDSPEQEEIKRNLYVKMLDKTTTANSTGAPKYIYSYGIRNGDKTLYNDAKILKHPMYCFEDVRFLGIDNSIQFKSDGAGPIIITIPFIFRRSYKIVDQD